MSTKQYDRRQFERFALEAAYSPITVNRISDGKMMELTGFVYDISEGGLRIELDERLQLGEHVNVEFVPPMVNLDDNCTVIRAACEVVWINDEIDDPAMPRMALSITKYQDHQGRNSLIQFLGSGHARRAA